MKEVIIIKSEDKAIKLIKKYGAWLLRRMPNFWDNKNVVMTAVAKDGFLLEVASRRLKKDKEIVYMAILTFPRALLLADEELTYDDDLRSLAFEINGKPFIANKKAFNHFKIHDDIMIKETTKIIKKSKNNLEDGSNLNGEEYIFDEDEVKKSLIYRKLHKLYKGEASLEEMVKYENSLKNKMFSKNFSYKKEQVNNSL